MPGRKPRTIPLTPEEQAFRFDRWVDKHLSVIDKSGPEWLCMCPECGRDKMAIHVTRKAWHCLSGECGIAGWTPTGLVAVTLRLPRSRAREVIAADALGAYTGPIEQLESDDRRRKFGRRLPQATLPPVAWGLPPEQWAYALGRGIPPEHMELFRIGTVLSDGSGSKADRNLTGRLIFPMWDRRGELVYWGTRAVREHPAKVINMPRSCRHEDHGDHCVCYHEAWGLVPVPEAAEAGEVVMGLHLIVPGKPVIVVEGLTDTAVCGPQFVGIMGSSITMEQADLIGKSGASEAIVLLDGDQAGVRGTPQVASILEQAISTRIATCPWGTDPGALGRMKAMEVAMAAPKQGTPGGLFDRRAKKLPAPKSYCPFVPGLD